MGSLGITLYAGLLGFALGAPVGVAFVGRWLLQGGSFGLALIGAVLALVLITVLVQNGLFSFSEVLFTIAVVISLVFAVLGYNLHRHSTV
jgi:hypothetical protein